MIERIVLAAFALVLSHAIEAATLPAVGFRTIALETRIDGAQQLSVSLWYPAQPDTAGARMSLRDYWAGDRTWHRRLQVPPGETVSDEAGLIRAMTGADDPTLWARATQALDAPMRASPGARPDQAKHPLLLWASRFGSDVYQAELSESLAAQGFVVATVRRSDGAHRMPFELPDAAARREELNARVTDTRAALDHLHLFPEIDAAQIHLLSFSYGGAIASHLAGTDRRVRGLIALDTQVLERMAYVPEVQADWLATQGRIPVFLLMGAGEADSGAPALPALWPRLSAGSYALRLKSFAHGNFNFIEGTLPNRLNLASVQSWARQDAASRASSEFLSDWLPRAIHAWHRHRPVPEVPESIGVAEFIP